MSDCDNAHTSAVSVKITGDSKSGYGFQFSDPDGLFDAEGNFDFTKYPAKGRAVKIGFMIDPSSVKGIQFKPDGPDAMWIALRSVVGAKGCPTEPYKGDIFVGFAVKENGQRLHVLDKNNDATMYRYNLRFDLNGETIVCDPDGGNGGGHG